MKTISLLMSFSNQQIPILQSKFVMWHSEILTLPVPILSTFRKIIKNCWAYYIIISGARILLTSLAPSSHCVWVYWEAPEGSAISDISLKNDFSIIFERHQIQNLLVADLTNASLYGLIWGEKLIKNLLRASLLIKMNSRILKA